MPEPVRPGFMVSMLNNLKLHARFMQASELPAPNNSHCLVICDPDAASVHHVFAFSMPCTAQSTLLYVLLDEQPGAMVVSIGNSEVNAVFGF